MKAELRWSIVDSDGARAKALAAELNKQYGGARASGSTDAAAALQGASGLSTPRRPAWTSCPACR